MCQNLAKNRYNLTQDPTEHFDIAASQPQLVAQMTARLIELNATCFSPRRGDVDPAACTVANERYHGFWGPFSNITHSS